MPKAKKQDEAAEAKKAAVKAAKDAEKAAKKAAKEAVKQATQDTPEADTAKVYHLFIKLNDREYETDTDNLAEAIQSFAPAVLKTKLIIQVTHIPTDRKQERVLYLQRGRVLFTNRYALEALVRNLLF